MAYDNWEARFQDTIDTPARNFNLGTGKVDMCSVRCFLTVDYKQHTRITNVSARGMAGTLYIDPTVNILPHTIIPSKGGSGEAITNKHPEDYTIMFNDAFKPNAEQAHYFLEDIYISCPSKTSLFGSINPMEVCMVHRPKSGGDRVLVTCTFFKSDNGQPTPEQENSALHKFLLQLARSENFPPKDPAPKKGKGKMYGITTNKWSPKMFLPPPGDRGFFSWRGPISPPRQGGNAVYIVFQDTKLVAPQEFLDKFASTYLHGGQASLIKAMNDPQYGKMNPNINIFFNENTIPDPPQQRLVCKTVVDQAQEDAFKQGKRAELNLQTKTVAAKLALKKRKAATQGRKSNTTATILIVLGVLLGAGLLVAGYVFYSRRNAQKAGQIASETAVTLTQVAKQATEMPTT